eukprot:TRINITY_DN3399_c0_g1_i2.p1 TRINITY_DN3399_c0_g1~~TRINITY_DN3399_c0_g1_i2.p1  ORF type:complete len:332 (-),score=-11.13 TRINITY_DN3399_c0_g1_i2:211-1206(-)
MFRLLRTLELFHPLNRIRFCNSFSHDPTITHAAKQHLDNLIYSSLCVEMMPIFDRSIYHAERDFFETKQEFLHRTSQLSFHELENPDLRHHGISIRNSDILSHHLPKSFQTCQADSGFSQKHHAVEFSRFSTNDSHTISYNYHPLYLLTRLFDESDVWGFPFRLLTKNQTLFDTAQMEIFEHFNIQVAMLSELPQSSINYSFQTCQADSGFSQKHHAVEFSRFSTNDSHTISYNYHPLYLLTRLFDESDVWGFPFRLLTKNQTLFDTAQMEIFEHFNIQVAMLSELPQSSINYRSTEELVARRRSFKKIINKELILKEHLKKFNLGWSYIP